MGQTPEPREARTETTTLGVETTMVPVAFEAIAKKMKGGDNKTAVAHLGEDSATPFHMETTLTVGGETSTFVESGHIEIGASYERAQTSAFKVLGAFQRTLALLGIHRTPMGRAIMASMEASRDGGDPEAALEAHGYTISEEAMAEATAFLASLATESRRTVSASVKVSLD